jgi:hypothetical protein
MIFNSIVFRFYKNFALSTGLVTAAGLFLCYQAASLSYAGIFTIVKMITNGLIGLTFHSFRRQDLFYYNNLGFSTRELYLKIFTLDMLSWLVALALIFQL